MRIFFDTEFTQFRDGQLLSAGFVAENDRSLYVEIDEPLRRIAASDFCQQQVIPQFGLVSDSKVFSDAEAGERIAIWLLSFGCSIILCYDYKLDWRFVEGAISASGLWGMVESFVRDHNIASDANQEPALAAQEDYLAAASSPGRHHALVDAFALRERWRMHVRLQAAHGAA